MLPRDPHPDIAAYSVNPPGWVPSHIITWCPAHLSQSDFRVQLISGAALIVYHYVFTSFHAVAILYTPVHRPYYFVLKNPNFVSRYLCTKEVNFLKKFLKQENYKNLVYTET